VPGADISLQGAIERLSDIYAPPEPIAEPLSQIVWENIGYLIDDARRRALFDEFEQRVGLEAAQIANAPVPILIDLARRGGMNPQTRVERLQRIAELTISECDGDLASRLRSLPVPKARALLKRFPAIGEPGADKILLFSGIAVRAAVDSNGLRALVRLGFCHEEKTYARSYRAAVALLAKDGYPDARWLKHAWLVLREHGKALCKRAAPVCEPCPLDRQCAHRAVAKL